jgi:hypothetical protein
MVSPQHAMAGKKYCTIKNSRAFACPARSIIRYPPRNRSRLRQSKYRTRPLWRNELHRLSANDCAKTGLGTFLPRNAAMPELLAGTLVAIPLRDKRLEATQVTLVQQAAKHHAF